MFFFSKYSKSIHYLNKNLNYSNNILTLIKNKNTNHLHVKIIPLFKDNYGYLIMDKNNKIMITIDPADIKPILNCIKKKEKMNYKLVATLTTHKHWDHVAGNLSLLEIYKNISIVGPFNENIPGMNYPVKNGDIINFNGLSIHVLDTPCHTKGHKSYYIPTNNNEKPILFSGDTLFVAGCGKFFEGTAADMYYSLYNVIAKLPLNTRIYCGHEYTLSNLKFALSIDKENKYLQLKYNNILKQIKNNNPITVPTTLEEELSYNPFLRVHEKAIRIATSESDPIKVLKTLRFQKDNFV